MEKSQNTPRLAVGMNGKRGFGGYCHILEFSLEDAPQQAAGFFTSAKSELGVDYGRAKRIFPV
jgi:hypothetical protein